MRTWREVAKRCRSGMDAMLFLNLFGVYLYICLVGTSDAPALILLAGLNLAIICISRFEEIKRELTPKPDPDELQNIIRRVK